MSLNKILFTYTFIFSFISSLNVAETDIKDDCTCINNVILHPIFGKILTVEPKFKSRQSSIYEYKEPKTGKKMVFKSIKLKGNSHAEAIHNEIEIMKMVFNRYDMMGMRDKSGCFYNKDRIFITMPRIENDLTELITMSDVENGGYLKDTLPWKIYASNYLVNSVTALHDMNIVHLDLKADNVLVKGNFNLILTDFGFSRKIGEITARDPYPVYNSDKAFGTPIFAAPEILKHKKFYRQTDIYALAITIIQIWFVNDVDSYNYFSNDFISDIFDKCADTSIKNSELTLSVFCKFYYPTVLTMLNEDFRARPIGDDLRSTFFDKTMLALEKLDRDMARLNRMKQGLNGQNQAYKHNFKLRDYKGCMNQLLAENAYRMNDDQDFKKFMLLMTVPFFSAYEDKGESCLGFPITDFMNSSFSDDAHTQTEGPIKMLI